MHRVGWLVDWVGNMAKSRLINEELGEKHLNYGIGIAFLQLTTAGIDPIQPPVPG
jgi:hypothetical protein